MSKKRKARGLEAPTGAPPDALPDAPSTTSPTRRQVDGEIDRRRATQPSSAASPAAPRPAAGAASTSAPERRTFFDASARRWLVAGMVVLVAVVLIYVNSLPNEFVFDDGDVVTTEPAIRQLANWPSILANTYRPLRTLTYAVDYAIWGLNPFGFRLTNILIHVANCVLALAIARRLLGDDRAAALVAVLFFAAHPAQPESVAYISGRRDVLFALFYLAGFLSYARSHDARTRAARLAWLALAGVNFVLSLMSKEMAASFPVACVLFDFMRANEADERAAAGGRTSVVGTLVHLARTRWPEYASAVLALVGFSYYTLFIRSATTRIDTSSGGGGVTFWGGSLLNNTLTVGLTYAHYAWLSLFPTTLSAQYYGAFDPAGGLLDWRVIPAWILLAALAAGSVYLLVARPDYRAVGFGVAWFLVTLVPASQILPHHEIVADHYLYLPLVGVGIALGGLAQAVARDRRRRTAVYAAATVVVFLFAARTIARNRDWHDDARLWEATYASVPDSPRAAYNLGVEMSKRGQHERAIRLYDQAIAEDPTWVSAYHNLALSYATIGKYDEAKKTYERAMATDLDLAARTWHATPEGLRALYRTRIAFIDSQAGRTEAARDNLASIVEEIPDLLTAQEAYAVVVNGRGELTETIARTRDRAETGDLNARLTYAHLLWVSNRNDEAFEQARVVLDARPDSALANYLVALYYGKFRPERAPTLTAASEHFDRAIRTSVVFTDSEAMRAVWARPRGR